MENLNSTPTSPISEQTVPTRGCLISSQASARSWGGNSPRSQSYSSEPTNQYESHDEFSLQTSGLDRSLPEAPSSLPSFNGIETGLRHANNTQSRPGSSSSPTEKAQSSGASTEEAPFSNLTNTNLIVTRQPPDGSTVHRTPTSPLIIFFHYVPAFLLAALIQVLLYTIYPTVPVWLHNSPSSPPLAPSASSPTHHSTINYTSSHGRVWRVHPDMVRLGTVRETEFSVPEVYTCMERCEDVETWCVGVNYIAGPAGYGRWCELMGAWDGETGKGRYLERAIDWEEGSCAERWE